MLGPTHLDTIRQEYIGSNAGCFCYSYTNQYGFIPVLTRESCRDIYQHNPTSHGKSGYYVIKIGNQPDFVYYAMELECGGEKSLMRVTSVDMSKGDECPNGWKITSPVAACRAPSDNAGCYSAQFSINQIPYNRVCGMMIGYQKGRLDAFWLLLILLMVHMLMESP